MTIREEEIPRGSVCCFGEGSCTITNTYGSGSGIVDEHYQLEMCISIYQIEFPPGRLIPVLKRKENIVKYHVAKIFDDRFSKLNYVMFLRNHHSKRNRGRKT